MLRYNELPISNDVEAFKSRDVSLGNDAVVREAHYSSMKYFFVGRRYGFVQGV